MTSLNFESIVASQPHFTDTGTFQTVTIVKFILSDNLIYDKMCKDKVQVCNSNDKTIARRQNSGVAFKFRPRKQSWALANPDDFPPKSFEAIPEGREAYGLRAACRASIRAPLGSPSALPAPGSDTFI